MLGPSGPGTGEGLRRDWLLLLSIVMCDTGQHITDNRSDSPTIISPLLQLVVVDLDTAPSARATVRNTCVLSP